MTRIDANVERLIQEGIKRGEFDNLPGQGEPMETGETAYDELWWIKKWLKRENLELLPAELNTRRKVERFLKELQRLHGEEEVRRRVASLNEEILKVLSSSALGPVTDLHPLSADHVAERWRETRIGEGKDR